ncbi:MAG: O-acetylhomoserine sulfhydrylase [Chitinivibrionales bacterium]|nr:O-acetylhomoserine sulfhydrylase [Chitinivibrionales bacterium]
MKGFTTRAIHASFLKKDAHGALRMPIYENVAFEFERSTDLESAFKGRLPSHAYSRITNPTVQQLENQVRLLSDALGVIAVASGMAAITNVFMAIARSGSNVVTTRHLFGHTLSLFEKTLGPWGLEVRYADFTDSAAVSASIDENTCAVFCETITNPQLEVADFRALSGPAGHHEVPLIVDGTLTTPYLFKTRQAGIAVEVLSSTKYISGGAPCVGGMIIDNGTFDWSKNPRLAESAAKTGPFALTAKLRTEVYRNAGACMSPHTAYLQSLGLETMALRIEKSCDNAMKLAAVLDSHPKVTHVNYPGLQRARFHEIARAHFGGRFGALLTLQLQSKAACFAFMDTLKIIRRATNLNDNKTLIIHPASTIFCEYSSDERQRMGIPDTLLRITVGIEDIEDLIDDIEKALEVI